MIQDCPSQEVLETHIHELDIGEFEVKLIEIDVFTGKLFQESAHTNFVVQRSLFLAMQWFAALTGRVAALELGDRFASRRVGVLPTKTAG